MNTSNNRLSAPLPASEWRLIEGLAREAHVPVAEVARLYQSERQSLARVAHVTRYLSIFARRNVLDLLGQRAAAARDQTDLHLPTS